MHLKISVRTVGPRQWAVTAGQLCVARTAREDFSRVGLLCGEIRCGANFYVFDVRSTVASPSLE